MPRPPSAVQYTKIRIKKGQAAAEKALEGLTTQFCQQGQAFMALIEKAPSAASEIDSIFNGLDKFNSLIRHLLENESRDRDQEEIFRELLHKDGDEFLHIAAVNGALINLEKILKEAKAVGHHFRTNPLNAALKNNQFEAARILITRHPITNPIDEEGNSALHHVCRMGHVPTLLSLIAILEIQEDVNFNLRGLNQRTALHLAAENGQAGTVNLLLETADKHHLEISPEDKDGVTPFLLAAREGHFEIVNMFLAHPRFKENPNPVLAADGTTLFHKAIAHKNKAAIIKTLPTLWSSANDGVEATLWKDICEGVSCSDAYHLEFCFFLEHLLLSSFTEERKQADIGMALSAAILYNNDTVNSDIINTAKKTNTLKNTLQCVKNIRKKSKGLPNYQQKLTAVEHKLSIEIAAEKRIFMDFIVARRAFFNAMSPEACPAESMPDNVSLLKKLRESHHALQEAIELNINQLKEIPDDDIAQARKKAADFKSELNTLQEQYQTHKKEFIDAQLGLINPLVASLEADLEWINDIIIRDITKIFASNMGTLEQRSILELKQKNLQLLLKEAEGQIKRSRKNLVPPAANFLFSLKEATHNILLELIVFEVEANKTKDREKIEEIKKQKEKIKREVKQLRNDILGQNAKINEALQSHVDKINSLFILADAPTKEKLLDLHRALGTIGQALRAQQAEISGCDKSDKVALRQRLYFASDEFKVLINKLKSMEEEISGQEMLIRESPAASLEASEQVQERVPSLLAYYHSKKHSEEDCSSKAKDGQAKRHLAATLHELSQDKNKRVDTPRRINALLLSMATYFESLKNTPITPQNRVFLDKSNKIRNAIFHCLMEDRGDRVYDRLYKFAQDLESATAVNNDAFLERFFKIYPRVKPKPEASLDIIQRHIDRLKQYALEILQGQVDIEMDLIAQSDIAFRIGQLHALLSDLDKLTQKGQNDKLSIELGGKIMRMFNNLHMTLPTLADFAKGVRHQGPDAIPKAAEAFCFALAKALSRSVEAEKKENEEIDSLAVIPPAPDLERQLSRLQLGC